MLAGPVSEWIGRAPEIGATLKDRLTVFDQPLSIVAPIGDGAVRHRQHHARRQSFDVEHRRAGRSLRHSRERSELLLFFGTLLFFLVGQIELRTQLVGMFGSHDTKLRFLKIMRDIEHNLAGYLTVVTIINAALGTIVCARHPG